MIDTTIITENMSSLRIYVINRPSSHYDRHVMTFADSADNRLETLNTLTLVSITSTHERQNCFSEGRCDIIFDGQHPSTSTGYCGKGKDTFDCLIVDN